VSAGRVSNALFANVQDGPNCDVDQDHAESPSPLAAGDAAGGSSTVMLINGPASGQPGRDAETSRPATLRPSDERSFCRPAGTPRQAELDAEAFKTAPIGLPDGQKPGSPAGAIAPGYGLSSAIPGSVTRRQGLDMVGVPPPAVEQQNRDSAHIAGHDSDHTSGGGQVSQYPASPPWTVQSLARSSLCDGSTVDGQGDCQPASAEPPAVAPAVTEERAGDYRRPSIFGASSIISVARSDRQRMLRPRRGPSSSHDHAGYDYPGSASLHRKRRRLTDTSSDDEARRSTKCQAFEDTSSTKRALRRGRKHALDSPRRETVLPVAFEARLRSVLGNQDQFNHLMMKMMKIFVSIIDDDAPSSVTGPAPSLVTPTGSVSQATDDAEQSDAEDDGSVASDDSESEAERYKRAGSRKTAQQTGQRRRWLPIEEQRLKVYMNDPGVEKRAAEARMTKVAWIAAYLNRSESAVKQHWEIMKGSPSLSQVWSSSGRVVPSIKQGHRSARDRRARLTKVMDATARSKPASTRRRYTTQNDEKIRQRSSFYDAGEEEWEVEEICGCRNMDDGGLQLHVKWKGGEKTWEPYENVADTEALDRYERIHGLG
jgi:hypothetical protein